MHTWCRSYWIKAGSPQCISDTCPQMRIIDNYLHHMIGIQWQDCLQCSLPDIDCIAVQKNRRCNQSQSISDRDRLEYHNSSHSYIPGLRKMCMSKPQQGNFGNYCYYQSRNRQHIWHIPINSYILHTYFCIFYTYLKLCRSSSRTHSYRSHRFNPWQKCSSCRWASMQRMIIAIVI